MKTPYRSLFLAITALTVTASFENLAHAQTLTTLYTFTKKTGEPDHSTLVQATNGYLYGTNGNGGAYGLGAAFRITLSGTLRTLYNFCSTKPSCPDGDQPFGLLQATDGQFYGVADETIFKMTPSGTLTALYTFSPNTPEEGYSPNSGLVEANNGDLYGTTFNGGAYSKGTIFKIARSGTLTTLYSFCAQSACPDGVEGDAFPLVQATDGNLYGTTAWGGVGMSSSKLIPGSGTVFKITPSGTLTTLYSFCVQSGCPDGANPVGLIQASDGNLYGTTDNGGGNGTGTVFRITLGGTLTTLTSYCTQSGCPDAPGELMQATDGNLYGVSAYGGTYGNGTVFKVTTSGALTTLYSFCSQGTPLCPDGENPDFGLMQATDGNLYGQTQYGGAHRQGTIFKLSLGLSPFVQTQPTTGKVGAAVKILGTDLTGASSVTFNGAAATFTVVSASEIKTTVPTGATTGTVEVITPSGPLSSNVVFGVP